MQISSFNNKLTAAVLAAALLGIGGGIIGTQAFSGPANTPATTTTATLPPAFNLAEAARPETAPATPATASAREVQAALNSQSPGVVYTQPQPMAATTTTTRTYSAAPRTVVRTNTVNRTTRTRYVSNRSNGGYYETQPAQRRSRSFWDKHRDKLTVAIGTGAGALLGKVIGGNKGAAIGALSGAGGSAIYTYKIRKRNKRY